MLDFVSLEEGYQWFEGNAPMFGFLQQGFYETTARLRGFYLKRPESRSYQEPGEICYVYEAPADQKARGNDYRVIICTTKRRIGFVSIDSGWVIIVNGAGKTVYSVGPFIRTNQHFFEDLLWNGRVNRWRVFYRPERCGEFMNLVPGRALKARYWQCAYHPQDRDHDRRFDDLREPFPPEVMEIIENRRKERRKRRKGVRAEGKDPFIAFKLRILHPWTKEFFSDEIQF